VLSAISTIVREHGWRPEVFEDMFLDDRDEKGLMFWYNDVVEVIKERDRQEKKAQRG